jgi:hypothetical protein
MAEAAEHHPTTGNAALVSALEVARTTPLAQAPNGLRYAIYGEATLEPHDALRLIQAVPATMGQALSGEAFYFVPLAMAGTRDARRDEPTLIAPAFTPELAESAICHRNLALDSIVAGSAEGIGPIQGTFISTRLMQDRFSLAFELFINAGHAFVETAGVPAAFSELVWNQATADVRGETSLDAWEHRNAALAHRAASSTAQPDEQARTAYAEAAFSDSVAIYLLSLALDFDYAELRERDYPLLAPQALADRLRHVHQLLPPNPGYEFAIRYRRRG